MLIIPDVSFYQDNNFTPRKIDFVKMRNEGVGGVIVRAGQNLWKDPDFDDYWRAAREAGLWRGTYWFWDSRVKPLDQANLWRSVISNDLPELGVWMDFEEGYSGGYRSEMHMQEFSERVRFLFPNSVKQGVYTSPGWWKSRASLLAYWEEYPLWIAHYGVLSPTIPAPWTQYLFWQYTSKGDGTRYGVESLNIDLSQYNGNRDCLGAFFGASGVPPVAPAHIDLFESNGDVRKFIEVK